MSLKDRERQSEGGERRRNLILDLCPEKGRRGKGWIIEGMGGLLATKWNTW